MTDDDKKAWSEAILENDRPHLNQCLQDLMDLGVDTNKFKSVNDRIHEIIENVFRVGHFRGFQAGRDSKGDGWCFDMDKAPRKGRFLAYGKGGEHITTWALCNPKKDMISPHSKPFAWMYLPQPPQDRKEG